MKQDNRLLPTEDELPEWAASDLWSGYEKWLDERKDDDRDIWTQ